jgi:hypothetical protein
MLCHSILRSGYSLEIIEKPLFTDFLIPRHPLYANLQTVDHLRRTEINTAYERDLHGLKVLSKGKFYFLIFDETPNSKNVPLLNILSVLIDVLAPIPKVVTALLSSEEIARCNAATVVTAVNAAVDLFEFEKVLLFCLYLSSDWYL